MIDLKTIPDGLKEGESWPILSLDPEWVWLARNDDAEIVGLLIAAPCHGLVIIWRLKMLPTAPYFSLGRLFRDFIREIRRRGCLGYVGLLDVVERPAEAILARIAFRAGAQFSTAATVVFGSVAGCSWSRSAVAAKHVGAR